MTQVVVALRGVVLRGTAASVMLGRTSGQAALFALLAVVSTGSVAQAADLFCVTNICASGDVAPACTVDQLRTVSPGQTLDCTGRNVVVKLFGTIRVDDGSFKLLADSLTVEGNASNAGVIKAAGTGSLGVELEIAGSVTINGNVQADGANGGGTITIRAGGNVDIADFGAKGLEASGTAGGASGGRIAINTPAAVIIENPVRATAGGGEAPGGQITVNAGGNIRVATSSGKLFVDGWGTDAGEIHLVSSGGSVDLLSPASVSADGHATGGNGGGIYLDAKDKVTVSAAVSARGGVGSSGNEATGGTLSIEAGCTGVDLLASLDIRGGEYGGGYDGGSLIVESLGDVNIGAGVVIDTHAVGGGGSGGGVEIGSQTGKISLGSGAKIDARGDGADPDGDGFAGSLTLSGCEVDIGASVEILASGLEGGEIVISSSSPLKNATLLHVSASAVIDASGVVSDDDGRILVAVANEALTGVCSTDPSLACTLDASCTIGCTPGTCDGLNPDTDDTFNQFVTTPEIDEDRNLEACYEACSQP